MAEAPTAADAPSVVVRDAAEGDIVAMAAIYDDLIATSDVIWYDEPLGVDVFRDRIADRLAGPDPVVVAVVDGTVVGYATYGPFRTLPGYAASVEHSIFAAPGHRGHGVGQRMLDELIGRARRAAKAVMIAASDGSNLGSIRFHRRNGFREVGRLPGVGRKWGRPVDLVLLQLDLGPPVAPGGAGVVAAIDHVQVAMPAGREDDARRFYQDLLGLPEVAKPPHLAARGGSWFESATAKVHLGVEEDFRPARKAHPALRIDGLRPLVDRLLAAGVAVVDDEPLPGHDRVYVDDPFGNRIELLEPV